MGFYQDGAPEDVPTLVSRLVNASYWEVSLHLIVHLIVPLTRFLRQRQCVLMFPEAFSEPPTPRVNETNRAYDGWFVQADRLFFANGQSGCHRSSVHALRRADRVHSV